MLESHRKPRSHNFRKVRLNQRCVVPCQSPSLSRSPSLSLFLSLHISLSPSLHVSLHCLLVFNLASIVFGLAHFLKRKSIAHIHHTSIMLDGDVGMLYITLYNYIISCRVPGWLLNPTEIFSILFQSTSVVHPTISSHFTAMLRLVPITPHPRKKSPAIHPLRRLNQRPLSKTLESQKKTHWNHQACQKKHVFSQFPLKLHHLYSPPRKVNLHLA